MGKRRLIPKLQMKSRLIGGQPQMVLVTTKGFSNPIDIGAPVSQARIYEAQAADELIFLDLDARAGDHDRQAVLATIRAAAEQIFMPFTVGGGVASVDDFRLLLENGADKVSVCTAAVENPVLLEQAAKRYGSQCVVLSIDYRCEADGVKRVYTHGGRKATTFDPIAWALEGAKRGAGEILLTAIDRDGTRQGLDTATAAALSDKLTVPLILSGGCGSAAHFIEGFIDGKADAVAAGTYFSFKDENPMQTRSRIKNAGIPIRILT